MQKLHKGREESEGEMVERREGDQKRADEVEVEKGVGCGPWSRIYQPPQEYPLASWRQRQQASKTIGCTGQIQGVIHDAGRIERAAIQRCSLVQ
jgi:hypothetical protein